MAKELREVTCLFSLSYLRSPIAGKNLNIMTPRRSTTRLPDYVTQEIMRSILQLQKKKMDVPNNGIEPKKYHTSNFVKVGRTGVTESAALPLKTE